MEMSPTIKEIAEALRQWHRLEITVSKDAVNPHFKSKFASLDNTIAKVKIPLSECGLSFAQFPDGDGLTTILMHTSGEWLKATANLKLAKQDPQGQGSAYTYGRRYALAAALGLAADEDDDGNEASKAPVALKTAVTAPKAVDPDKAAKIKIAGLVKALGHINVDKDTYPDLIKRLTQLELIPEAYNEIIDRLKTLVEEKNTK
jgi:hypothetical protein